MPALKCLAAHSAHAKRLANDLRCNEDQQLCLVILFLVMPEEETDIGHVTQYRNPRRNVPLILGVNAADDNRTPIVDQHFRLDMLGINGHTGTRSNLCVRRILVDVHSQVDPAIRGYLRFDLQCQVGFPEGNAGRAGTGCLLIGDFNPLFNQRFDLVCRNDAWAGDDFAFAICLQCTQLQVQKPRGCTIEEHE